MPQHASTYSGLTHTIEGSKHLFSESSHVAYQIKGNAHILSLHTPSTPDVGPKGNACSY